MIGRTWELYDLIIEGFRQKIEDEVHALADGTATDFPDYRFRVGRLAGLAEAIDIAEDAKKRLLDS